VIWWCAALSRLPPDHYHPSFIGCVSNAVPVLALRFTLFA
jgi:hypothetical protein